MSVSDNFRSCHLREELKAALAKALLARQDKEHNQACPAGSKTATSNTKKWALKW